MITENRVRLSQQQECCRRGLIRPTQAAALRRIDPPNRYGGWATTAVTPALPPPGTPNASPVPNESARQNAHERGIGALIGMRPFAQLASSERLRRSYRVLRRGTSPRRGEGGIDEVKGRLVGVLLDTCVVSDLRRGFRFPTLCDWMRSLPVDEIAIPTIAVAEMRHGIDTLRAREAAAAANIGAWLDNLLTVIATISFDARAAATYADVAAVSHHDGTASFERDLMIAAIAATHGYTLATRDVRHFGPMSAAYPRLAIVDPYDPQWTGRLPAKAASDGRRR